MFMPRKRVYGINRDADAARLRRIVAATNAFIARGQRVAITIGHTPGQGYNRNLTLDVGSDRSATNFSTDGLWVYADLETDPVFDDVVKRYRQISCEVFFDDVITPIALLAANRPAIELDPIKYNLDPNLDLSKYVLKYEHQGEHQTYTCPPEEEDIEMDVSAVKNLIGEALLSSDLQAKINALTDQVAQLQVKAGAHDEFQAKIDWLLKEEAEQAEAAEGLEAQPGEEASESPAEAVKEDAAAEAEEHPELPASEVEKIAKDHVAEGKGEEKPKVEEKNDMGGGAPGMAAAASGTNTFVPGTAGMTPPEEKKKPIKKNYEELELERETYRLEAENNRAVADDYAARIAAAEADKATLAASNADLVRKYAMERRHGELIQLAQRYQFDPTAEMAIVEKMDDAQFETHKAQVVTKYAMPPVNKAPVVVGELLPPAPLDADPNQIPEKGRFNRKALQAMVTKYALENHLTPDQAWAKREEVWRNNGVV
jgi:hypothetical protein